MRLKNENKRKKGGLETYWIDEDGLTYVKGGSATENREEKEDMNKNNYIFKSINLFLNHTLIFDTIPNNILVDND